MERDLPAVCRRANGGAVCRRRRRKYRRATKRGKTLPTNAASRLGPSRRSPARTCNTGPPRPAAGAASLTTPRVTTPPGRQSRRRYRAPPNSRSRPAEPVDSACTPLAVASRKGSQFVPHPPAAVLSAKPRCTGERAPGGCLCEIFARDKSSENALAALPCCAFFHPACLQKTRPQSRSENNLALRPTTGSKVSSRRLLRPSRFSRQRRLQQILHWACLQCE